MQQWYLASELAVPALTARATARAKCIDSQTSSQIRFCMLQRWLDYLRSVVTSAKYRSDGRSRKINVVIDIPRYFTVVADYGLLFMFIAVVVP